MQWVSISSSTEPIVQALRDCKWNAISLERWSARGGPIYGHVHGESSYDGWRSLVDETLFRSESIN